MDLDVTSLIADIKTAATGVLNQDLPAIKGFSEQQLEAMANQAKVVAAGIATGQITPALQSYFLDQLKQMAVTFMQTLVGLTLATIQALWNAVVGSIWGWLSKATGVDFSAPSFAETPFANA